MNKMFIALFVCISIIGFGCAGDPRGHEDDRAAPTGVGGAGGEKAETCVGKFVGAECGTNCSPECDGKLVCILGALEPAEDAKGLCEDTASSTSSSGSTSSSSGSSSSSGESSTSTSSSGGSNGKACQGYFEWVPTSWTPAESANVYTMGSAGKDANGNVVGSWSAPGICQMSKDGTKRYCTVGLLDKAVVTFQIRLDNPGSATKFSWGFDQGNWPGGGNGKDVGTTTVKVAGNTVAYTKVESDPSDGLAETKNGQFTVNCP
jgi:hypothetical protein